MTTWTEVPLFDGPNDPDDTGRNDRLQSQLVRVYRYMRNLNGALTTLPTVCDDLGLSAASLSARLRDLRKPRFGGFTIEREHIENGLYAYRLVPGSGDEQYVYVPLPANNEKAEAAKRIREFLRVQSQHGPRHLYSAGAHLDLNDLRTVVGS